jgi:hypothetical protein
MSGIAAAALVAASPVSAAGKARDVSWGKAGVSFADYRLDAGQCAARTFGVTLHLTPRPSRALNNAGNGSNLGLIAYRNLVPPEVALSPSNVRFYSTTYVETYRHATRVDFAEQLQAILDECLVERGYRQFRLTDAQMDRLRRLEKGSAERARYLYGLGTDADVLAAQAI